VQAALPAVARLIKMEGRESWRNSFFTWHTSGRHDDSRQNAVVVVMVG
jgi:hypothetical protein